MFKTMNGEGFDPKTIAINETTVTGRGKSIKLAKTNPNPGVIPIRQTILLDKVISKPTVNTNGLFVNCLVL